MNTDKNLQETPCAWALIPLYRYGQVVGHAKVDKQDVPLVSRWQWHLQRGRKTSYAYRSEHIKGTASDSRGYYMHRVILGLPAGSGHSIQADHIDFDGLNNTRANLRIVTNSENKLHRRLFSNNTSGEPNVAYIPTARGPNKWSAHIKRGGRMILHKHFATKAEAIAARDTALSAYEAKRRSESA